ncbi:MAG TPA: hypothetical protein VJI74_01830 [Candidatus Paceibacterota bacterium]
MAYYASGIVFWGRKRVSTEQLVFPGRIRLIPKRGKIIPEITQELIERAGAAGHRAEKVFRKGGASTLATTFLTVDNRLCHVHYLQAYRTPRNSKRRYVYVNICRLALKRTEASIFYLAVPGGIKRFFIIPSAVLLEVYFKDPARKRWHLYLPVDRLGRHRQRINFWSYENAWGSISR